MPIGALGPARRACREARRVADAARPAAAASISVNLSARQFQDPDLVADVSAALAVSGLDASRLVLEITESVLHADAAPRPSIA